MSLPNKTSAYTGSFLANMPKAAEAIRDVESIIVGIGAGMSASGGLCYTDPALAEKWYPTYAAMGKRSIIEIMQGLWPNALSEQIATKFWGFWAQHIWHIRYEAAVTLPYVMLSKLLGDKNYFIISTNADGQVEKAGFPQAQVFAPQGDYAFFQCEKPCCQVVYNNREMIEAMISHMPSDMEIRHADIPRCPKCGAFLIPNLRSGANFVEAPHMRHMQAYESFIENNRNKKLVFLELGVGFNTPGIIRLPFEQMTARLPQAMLIRINRDDVQTHFDVAEKYLGIQGDIAAVLSQMLLR